MSLSYPYSKALFADALRLKQATFLPAYGQEYSGQASGVIRAKDLRPALWKADVTTVSLRWNDANDIQALLEGLDGSIQTFYLYNPIRPYPKIGQIVDTNVKILALGGDGISLSLKGMPAGATLTRGDMISFAYGARPSIALHRVLETVTADGSGNTGLFQISNGLRSGATVNTAVVLNKAYGEFRMMSGFTQNSDSTITATYTFSAIQVL